MKKCPNCGNALEDYASFCNRCGSAAGEASEKNMGTKKKNTGLMLAIVIPILVVALGAGYFAVRTSGGFGQKKEETAEQTEKSEKKNQKEEETESDAETKSEEVEVVLAQAKEYLNQQEYDKAQEELEKIKVQEGEEAYDQYQKLLAAAEFKPEIQEIDTGNFPYVKVTLNHGENNQFPMEAMTVKENETSCPILDFRDEKGTAVFRYEASGGTGSSGNRTLALTLEVGGFTFQKNMEYAEPVFQDARLSLVSTDVSQYPLIKTYFRVENPETGAALEGLDSQSFVIQERLSGGDYLYREVKNVTPLDGRQGLNIGLVADKSSSINYNDMDKIKNIMIEFVGKLQYEAGDKAEILAFDSIVQQMCNYTNNRNLLTNGINNMSPDGSTAFYDAVYNGVSHAALQGGARCVIAFTDGMDNESRHTADELVRYANDCQVPVYIIGVGYEVEESILQNIAAKTQGKYWFIDDLYDLQTIFDEIYKEQKKLYAVEYVSDSSQDAYLSRDLNVSVTGNGYQAKEAVAFTPVHSIEEDVHTSRYEIFKEALTWEEAAQKCEEMGGHLAAITSKDEMEQLIRMAEGNGLNYLWIGGYTSYDSSGNVFGHWVTGEEFSYSAWSEGEPSRKDADGTDEWYLMLWNVPELGGWSWNDQRNDPLPFAPAMEDTMGYICEFE